MNRNHRSIWNSKTNSWVAVSEHTSAKGRRSQKAKTSYSGITKWVQTTVVALGTLAASQAAQAVSCSGVLNFAAVITSFNCDQGSIDGIQTNSAPGPLTLSISNTAGNMSVNGPISFGDSTAFNSLNINKTSSTNSLNLSGMSSINMGSGHGQLQIQGDSNFDVNSPIYFGSSATLYIAKFVTVNGDITGSTGSSNIRVGGVGENGNSIVNGKITTQDGDDYLSMYNDDALINGDVNLGGGNNRITLNKGSAKKLQTGQGQDYVKLYGSFNFQSPDLKIDAGNDIAKSSVDSLYLFNVNGNITAANFINFERLDVGSGMAGDDSQSTVNFIGSQFTLGTVVPGPMTQGTPGFFISKGSEVKFSSNNFIINSPSGLFNSGTVNLRGTAPGKTLFLNGSYTGDAGSQILFNTKLGNDNSLTDRMVVTGSTFGESKVFVNNIGGTGAKTVDGINLIEVQGSSDAVFTLGAPVQVGSWEYFLFKKGKNWNLESSGGGDENTVKPVPTPTPSPSSTPTPTPTPKIYRSAVSGYLQAAQTQFDQNANLVGTLEQRQASINNTGDIWGRVIADKSSKKTSTFGYEQSSQTLQFGKDIIDTKSAAGDQTKVGVTVGLGQQSSSYSDQIRAFTSTGIHTGASETTEFALGAYYTQRNEVNPYMDLQAHIIGSRTQFNDVYDGTAKQTGLGVALSAELGKDIALGNTGLDITPQAQAVYQNHSYSGFNDATSDVAKQNAESLRVRAGITLKASKAKLAANDSKTSWNASINVLQEVLDNPSRTVAGNVVNADNQQKPWLEVGVGVNHQLNEASSLTAQISHKRSLSGNQQSGNAVNVVYRFKW